MLKTEMGQILALLNTTEYSTAGQLAEKLNLSEKTVRGRIKEVNSQLAEYGAFIESKPRFGFILIVEDEEKFQKLLSEVPADEPVPVNFGERVSYLIVFFLNQDGYMKLDDLCDFLYVSKTTLSAALKAAESVLEQYGIRLERRPNYGIRAVGKEIDIRRCLGELFVRNHALKGFGIKRMNQQLEEMASIVQQYTKEYKIKFSENAFENFITFLYIQRGRVERGKAIALNKDDIQNLSEKEWEFVYAIKEACEQRKSVSYSESEVAYIALHLAGKRMVGTGEQDELNFVIRSDIDQMVLEMLDVVYREFNVDMRNSFDLRMSLNQHMAPLDIRIRYKMMLKNEMLEEIKEKYGVAYWMARTSAVVLKNYYGQEIPEDEIGYIALLYELELEKRETSHREKKSILIVCGSGKGSSRLLRYKFWQVFGEYLKDIYICDLFELESFEIEKVDYVITTVVIFQHIPKPIIEINQFLDEKDIINVKKLFESRRTETLLDYYSPQNFASDIEGTTREGVLGQICERLNSTEGLPEGFLQLVMEREQFGSTDYGNLVAIPHPIRSVTKESFVFVAVLSKPILWNRQMVQVVLMTVIGNQIDKHLGEFYEATIEFIQDKQKVEELIAHPSFDNFIYLLEA